MSVIGSIAFPYRYETDGNLPTVSAEQSLANNIQNSVMIQKSNVPLRLDLGSNVPMMPFDPNDDILKEAVIAEAEHAIAVGEPRVTVDKTVRIARSADANTAQLAIAYYPNTMDWEFKNLFIPLSSID